MEKVSKKTLEEKKAILNAKSRIVDNMPSPYEIRTLEDYKTSYWRYDEDRYEEDKDYREEIRVAWERECLERRAYNEVLDSVYSFLLA